ncbi:MAG: hypothetical protein R3E91_00195 [Chlamydiales bacterium]
MQIIRGIVITTGLFFLLLGVLLMSGMSNAPGIWLNNYLIGATISAYAISILWVAVTETYKAFIGGGISIMIALGGGGLSLLHLSTETRGMMYLGELCLYTAILFIWFFFLGLKFSKKSTHSLPSTTRWLFGLMFTVVLIEGLYLIVPIPGRFPWLLSQEFSIFYGWILMGSSLFFGWSFIQSSWDNGYPLLYSLIVYNMLLIGPLLSLLKSSFQVTVIPFYLWFSIIVIIGSGIWAIFELINRFFSIKKS